MERLIDILISSIMVVLLSPLMIPIIVLLKCTGEGEIFFLQKRVGIRGQSFNLYKFATMLKDSPNIGTGTITTKDDPRILPIGKLLRKTKINELPQLLNILFGHMSFIGPRPLTEKNFRFYSHETQSEVIKIRPGLSGIGSIIFRNEEEILSNELGGVNFYKNHIAPYKGSLERWYVLNKSLKNYFLLILVTIHAVLNPESKIVWKVFKNLPEPPEELKKTINYI